MKIFTLSNLVIVIKLLVSKEPHPSFILLKNKLWLANSKS